MKAITIHAPWAWAIISGYKRFENRTWETRHRGELWIHAGKSTASDQKANKVFDDLGIDYPKSWDDIRGKIIGRVELTRIVDPTGDPFATGPRCWELDCPQGIEPISINGRQSIWEFSQERIANRNRSARKERSH
jgi:hypothetical protein